MTKSSYYRLVVGAFFIVANSDKSPLKDRKEPQISLRISVNTV